VSSIAQVLPAYRAWRYRVYSWRRELSIAKKAALAFGMAALTGLAAQVRLPLPFTPVPITGQTFAVLLAGVMLGGFYGGLSQVIYVGLGAGGVPWFAGLSGGFGILTGATGGYLAGFIVAAALIGFVCDRCPGARRFWPQLGLMAVGSVIIYACGAFYLSRVIHSSLARTLELGVWPFVPGDAVKAFAAACLSTALLPKASDRSASDGAGSLPEP
jgi:biotin transport system substrate-specific component